MQNITRRNFIKSGIFASFMASIGATFAGCASVEAKKQRFMIGVTDWDAAVKNQPIPDVFDVAKLSGMQGIQLSASPRKAGSTVAVAPTTMKRYKARLAETGLVCCSLCLPCFHKMRFWEDDKNAEYLRSAIDAAVELGSKDILLPFFGKNSAMNGRMVGDKCKIGGAIVPEYYEKVVAKLKAVAPYAEKKGVTLSLEDTISADDNIKIVDAVASPNVKVYFDIYNIEHYGFDAVDALKKLKKGYISQIHIKTKSGLLDKEQVMPKNLDAVWQGILDSDYSGWLVLEYQAKPKNMTRVELLRYTADVLRKSPLFK